MVYMVYMVYNCVYYCMLYALCVYTCYMLHTSLAEPAVVQHDEIDPDLRRARGHLHDIVCCMLYVVCGSRGRGVCVMCICIIFIGVVSVVS
jgi:hypothetical protein